MPRPLTDITGQRFGKLVVLSQHTEKTKYNRTKWLCECDCGNTIAAISSNLVSGSTHNCGCLAKLGNTTHGQTSSPEYYTWANLKARCYNQNDPGVCNNRNQLQ
jgi:hypothetical protein